jgi:hypothetical protein
MQQQQGKSPTATSSAASLHFFEFCSHPRQHQQKAEWQ